MEDKNRIKSTFRLIYGTKKDVQMQLNQWNTTYFYIDVEHCTPFIQNGDLYFSALVQRFKKEE